MTPLSDRPFPGWTPRFGERVEYLWGRSPRRVAVATYVRMERHDRSRVWLVADAAGSFWFIDPRAALRRLPSAEDKLRAFARAVMEGFPETHGVDGFDAQDLAVKYGLLAPVEVTEPCGEGCACAEFDDDFSGGATCYRRTALLTGEGG